MTEAQEEVAPGVSSQADLPTSWPPEEFSSDIIKVRSTSSVPTSGGRAIVEEEVAVEVSAQRAPRSKISLAAALVIVRTYYSYL